MEEFLAAVWLEFFGVTANIFAFLKIGEVVVADLSLRRGLELDTACGVCSQGIPVYLVVDAVFFRVAPEAYSGTERADNCVIAKDIAVAAGIHSARFFVFLSAAIVVFDNVARSAFFDVHAFVPLGVKGIVVYPIRV